MIQSMQPQCPPALTATIVEVENVGSPDRLRLRVNLTGDVCGSSVMTEATFGAVREEWERIGADVYWPPKAGDKFPVKLSVCELRRAS